MMPPVPRDVGRNVRDGVVLAILAGGGLLVADAAGCPWLLTNGLVLGLPLAYLLATAPAVRTRLDTKFVLLLVVFGALAFDSLARRTDAWGGASLLSFHLPGRVSVEEFVWILFFFPLTLAINERFFAPSGVEPFRRQSKLYLKGGFYLGLLLVLLPTPDQWIGDYAYLKIGTALYLPAFVLALLVQPSVWRELLASLAITGPLNLGFEIVALRQGYWTFPGQYLGWTTLGGVRYPVEELVFLILASGPSLVATNAIAKNWRWNRLAEKEAGR